LSRVPVRGAGQIRVRSAGGGNGRPKRTAQHREPKTSPERLVSATIPSGWGSDERSPPVTSAGGTPNRHA
jgi:hypothetical protein